MRENVRTIPPRLAPVVSGLELRGATIVSASEIATLAGAEPQSAAARDLVRRLVEHQWLRPLPTRGLYEFLPGAAGPYSRNDALDTLRAAAGASRLRPQVVLTGAAFLRGFSDRAPVEYDIVVVVDQPISAALRSAYRVHWAAPRRIFGGEIVNGVLASTRERLLVDVALWPALVGGALQLRDHWLAAALAGASTDTVVEMLRTLDSASASARAGYLAMRFDRLDVADAIAGLGRSRVAVPLIPGIAPSTAAHRDKRFNVVDQVGAARRS